jgi:zinc finger CCHC domain-containing protein 9
MTRITNIGRKRSYVEASFSYEGDDLPQEEPTPTVQEAVAAEDEKPPKKKRKRGKKPKEAAAEPDTVVQEAGSDTPKKPKKSKSNSFKGVSRLRRNFSL